MASLRIFSTFRRFDIKNTDSMRSLLTARLRGKLGSIGAMVDALPETTLAAVDADIVAAGGDANKRGEWMSAAQISRAMAIKHSTACSHDELAFHLQDSLILRAFCRIAPGDLLSEQMVERSIGCITEKTWEVVSRQLGACGS